MYSRVVLHTRLAIWHRMHVQLIGLCSFLLIGYWTTRVAATKSAIKAMLVNRISDTFLVISILSVLWYLGSGEYSTLCLFDSFNLGYSLPSSEYTPVIYSGLSAWDWICLTMFVGAAGKSAQVFLHTWLADAMEAFEFKPSWSVLYIFLCLVCFVCFVDGFCCLNLFAPSYYCCLECMRYCKRPREFEKLYGRKPYKPLSDAGNFRIAPQRWQHCRSKRS